MKTVRRLLLVFGLVVILNSAVVSPSHLVPLALGLIEVTAGDLAIAAAWLLALASGFGLLYLQDWARRLLLVLVSLRFLLIAHTLLTLRNLEWDHFGGLLALAGMGIYPVLLLLLVSAAPVTRTHLDYRQRHWAAAGVLTAVLGIGIYGAAISEEPIRLEGLPKVSTGDLEFLRAHDAWHLQKLTIAGSQNGKILFSSRNAGILSVDVSNDLATLKGIPELERLAIRIDLSRNALLINDSVFPGEPHDTDRLLWQDIRAKGVIFERDFGRIAGTVSIFQRASGTMLIMMSTLDVYGKELEYVYSAQPM